MLIITSDALFLSVGAVGLWVACHRLCPLRDHRVNSTMQPFSNRAPLVGEAQPDERTASFIKTGAAGADPRQPERSCLFTTR